MMQGAKRQRVAGGVAVGGVASDGKAESSKKKVYLDMCHLISTTFEYLKGPTFEVTTALRENPFKKVSVRFNASKIPFEMKFGPQDHHITLSGGSFLNEKEAQIDASTKVAAYFRNKFGVHFVDWNYEQTKIEMKKSAEVEKNILDAITNTKRMVQNWRGSISLLKREQRVFAAATNPFQLVLAGQLVSLKSEAEACIENVSDKMKEAHSEHMQCSKTQPNNLQEDAITIKISEIDILDDILLSLGADEAKCSHIVQDNNMFKDVCKIKVDGTATRRKVGKTIFQGEAKSSAYEAECCAAGKAIAFLERDLNIAIVDLNFQGMLEKQHTLKRLKEVEQQYLSIQKLVKIEWMTMISELKSIVNTQFESSKDLGFEVEEHVITESNVMVQQDVAEMTFMYNFCNMGLNDATT